jgi:hypothetical protein
MIMTHQNKFQQTSGHISSSLSELWLPAIPVSIDGMEPSLSLLVSSRASVASSWLLFEGPLFP